jgi:hypothetical protein
LLLLFLLLLLLLLGDLKEGYRTSAKWTGTGPRGLKFDGIEEEEETEYQHDKCEKKTN